MIFNKYSAEKVKKYYILLLCVFFLKRKFLDPPISLQNRIKGFYLSPYNYNCIIYMNYNKARL